MPGAYSDYAPNVKAKSDYAPLGTKSKVMHDADMQFDAGQRRAALRAFMSRMGLTVVSQWEKQSGLGSGTLRKFLDGSSNTMTDKNYQKLAAGAAKILGVTVTIGELQGEHIEEEISEANNSQSESHDGVISHMHTAKLLSTEGEPLILFRSEAGGARGGNTLIYKEKVGEMDRLVRFRYAKHAFCIEATDDLMRPHHRTRDTLIIDPDKSCAADDDCIFVKDPRANPLDTVVRHLVRITPTAWIVREHNGRKGEYEILRSEFTKAWKIVAVIVP